LINKLKILKIQDTDKYFELSSKLGLDFKIGNTEAWQIVGNIFNFSSNNLNSKERMYLEPILNLIKQRKTPADILIGNNIENACDLINFL